MTDRDIIYEDDYIFVINKPAGLVVNNSETSPFDTLQNFVKEKFKFYDSDNSEFFLRSGIVHRLDKDTSGVVIAVKNADIFEKVKSQFKERTVKKEYLAVTLGKIADPIIEINAPIKRDPKFRMRMAVHHEGRPAFTRIEPEKAVGQNLVEMTLIKVFPQTGRTHQIRVHLSAINHPVIGDKIYMTKKQYEDTIGIFGRLMLHAWKITINHPVLENSMTFEAPMPDEFSKLYSK